MNSERALAIGACFGLLLALASVLRPGPATGILPGGVVATVAGAPITAQAHQRVTNALISDSSIDLSQASERALERLIDEEIAIQHGVSIGLVERDPNIRSLLVDGVLQSIEARAQDGPPPTTDQLRALYQEQPGRFSTTAQVQVKYALFTGPDSHARARQAREIFRTGGTVQSDSVAPLPQGMIPLTKLRDYIGDAPTQAVKTLRPGTVSQVIHTDSGAHVVKLEHVQSGTPPPFEDTLEAVETQWRRERADRAVRDFFSNARRVTPITRAK